MLMFQVDIGKYEHWNDELPQCQPWWQNFVNSEVIKHVTKPDEVDKVYKQNGIVYNGGDTRYVYFESEERFTWFLLRWS